MFIINNYIIAIIFCIITMLCWGSWANTQKLAQGKWRHELFYWDYVIGILIFSLVAAFTLGNYGQDGRSFIEDLRQADKANMTQAIIGGIVFNAANILLTASIAGAGMAVAFPVGIGLALVIGVVINYIILSKGNPVLLFTGVILITAAIIVNALAYSIHRGSGEKKGVAKWIIISIIAGVLMSTFYPFIASSMDIENFVSPAVGKMTPYTAFVMFAVGIFISNIIFNTILMRKPFEGAPIRYSTYFKGRNIHFVGVFGGAIWGLGNLFNLIAAGKAGPAISYGLGQGATLVAAFWGVVIWKEFKGGSATVRKLIALMFFLFIAGLALIIAAGA